MLVFKKIADLRLFGMPISSILGISLILVFLSFTTVAIILYPGTYNPITNNNYLSDLGLSVENSFSDVYGLVANPIGAIFFNLGLMITGILICVFFLSLSNWSLDSQRQKLLLISTQILGCLSGLSLVLLGIFSENYWNEHLLVTFVFFSFTLLWLVTLSFALYTHPHFGKIKASFGIIAFLTNLVFLVFFDTLAILEWITVGSLIGYVILLSYSTIKLGNSEPA